MPNPSRILVVAPAWIGDMMMAQTLFMLLKQQNPKVLIDVLAPAWTRPLTQRMPQVHEVIDAPFKHGEIAWGKRYRLGRQLQNHYYDQAIVLPNSWKSALVPFFARISQRTGWLGEVRYGLLNDYRKLDKIKYPLMIERFMALGLPSDAVLEKPYPRPELIIDEHQVNVSLHELTLPHPASPILALCPGAEFGPAKRWPARYYAEVANYYLRRGWAVWLFGSANDVAVTTEIQELTQQRCVDLAGKTSLTMAVDLLSLATKVLTNDSGLMHIAAALKKPLVVVYGSTSPQFTPPLSDHVNILSLNLPCSPCFQRECPLHHLKCLQDLLPTQVIQALKTISE